MINNFWFLEDQIGELCEGDFYPIMIIKRRKDNPDMNQNCKIIYRTNIYNKEDLQQDKLISLCKENNARCYMKINKRSDQIVSQNMLRCVVDNHLKGNYAYMKNAYDHCVGISDASDVRYFLIDIDKIEENTKSINDVVSTIESYLSDLKKNNRMKDGPIYKLPTKNGYHVLAPGFDSREISQFPCYEISVRKDAETLLYF